jgi:hypothetical protein
MLNVVTAVGAVLILAIVFGLVVWPWGGTEHAKAAAVYFYVFFLAPITVCASGLAFFITVAFSGGGKS